MIHQLGERRSEVERQVKSMQGADVKQVKEFQMRLEQEIAELKRRDTELEKISDTLTHC